MPNKNYIKGYNFELSVKKKLEDLGYFVVRSGGSHTVADLVAIGPGPEGDTLVIQCKTGKAYMKYDEAKKFRDLCERTGKTGLIASKPRRGKIELMDISQMELHEHS